MSCSYIFTPCTNIKVSCQLPGRQLLFEKAAQVAVLDNYFFKKLGNYLSWTIIFWRRCATSCPGQPLLKKMLCNALIVVWGGRRRPSLVSSCHGNNFVPGNYILTSWQNRMSACMGDTFIGGERHQATEKQTEMIAMRRQPLRRPSPLRSTNARKKTPSSSQGERTQSSTQKWSATNKTSADVYNWLRIAASNQSTRYQLIMTISLNVFPTWLGLLFTRACQEFHKRSWSHPERKQYKAQHPKPTNTEPPAVLVMPHMVRDCDNSLTCTSKYPFPKATKHVWTDVVLCAAPLDLRRLFGSESQEVIFNNC